MAGQKTVKRALSSPILPLIIDSLSLRCHGMMNNKTGSKLHFSPGFILPNQILPSSGRPFFMFTSSRIISY